MARALRPLIAVALPVLLSLTTLSPVLADASWATAQSIDGYDSYSQIPQVDMDGTDVAVVWVQDTDMNNGTYSIQSNRSTDGGETWEGKTRVSDDSLYYCTDLRMAMSGSNVVAIWYQYHGGTVSIQSSCSTDNGATWSSQVRVDDAATGSASEPDVAIDGSNVVATWKQSDGVNSTLVMTNWSSDGGATWEGSQGVDFDYGDAQQLAEYPKVVIEGQNAVVGWKTSVRESGVYNKRVYTNKSDDGGETWDGAQLLSSGTESYSPELAISGSTVMAIWNDNDSGTSMYYNRSTDGGATWDGPARLDNGAVGGKYNPDIEISGSNVVAVWKQWNGAVSVVWSNCSDDGGATWDGAQQIDSSCTSEMQEPRVAVSGSTAVTVWYHNDGTAQRVYSSFSTDGGETWSDMQRIQGDDAIRASWTRVAMDGTRAVAVWQQHDNMNSRVDVFTNYFEEPEGVDISLKAGWNMVSVPVDTGDTPADEVFEGAEAVYWYDPATKSYTIPTNIDPKKGYWVAVESGTTITATGDPVENWTDTLSAGWNMIGSVSGESIAVDDVNDDPADTLQAGSIYTWNPTGKSYSIATQIEEGNGYWAACTETCTLTIGPPPA